MNLEIITPEKKVYEGEVSSIILPGSSGVFQILNNHAAIVSTLKKGILKVRDTNKQEKEFDINGGVIEFHKNTAIILTD